MTLTRPPSGRVSGFLLLVLVAALGACNGERRNDEARNASRVGQSPLDFSRVEEVAGGLEVPWALAFPDRSRILVTERAGRVRLIDRGRLRAVPLAKLDVVARGEGGLLGIALHPDFPRRRFAYLYYTAEDGNRVSRFRLSRDFRFRDEKVLLRGIPAGTIHDGGRIAFGPDGMLYVATGETGNPPLAANRRSLAGKLLRLRPDGRVPEGNRFRASPVFSYGHRNPQGFDWDGKGRLYASEHGPSGELGLCCHDEVNLIERGRFYGWPFRAGRVRAMRGDPPERPVAPIAESGAATWAPAGLAVHEPRGGPTSLFVATLRGQRLLRFVLAKGNPRRVARVGVALAGFGRLRAASFGPDGCLYLTTSNRDGRGEPRRNDDRVLRMCPRR